MERMKRMNRHEFFVRIAACLSGNLLISVGVTFAKLAALGNDPFNASCMSVSAFFGLSYPVYTWIFNLLLFTAELLWGRKYIHVGTFINWFLISYAVSFFLKTYAALAPAPAALWAKILFLGAGLLICSLGLSVYQSADLGVAPYDVLPMLMCNKWKKLPFFWARMSVDVTCVVTILLTLNPEDHLLGVGTVLFAFGLGPVIHAFTALLRRLFPTSVLYAET